MTSPGIGSTPLRSALRGAARRKLLGETEAGAVAKSVVRKQNPNGILQACQAATFEIKAALSVMQSELKKDGTTSGILWATPLKHCDPEGMDQPLCSMVFG